MQPLVIEQQQNKVTTAAERATSRLAFTSLFSRLIGQWCWSRIFSALPMCSEESDECLVPHELHASSVNQDLTGFNKIATQGAPQMAVDKEANSLSRVYSYYSKFNLRLFYV